jgi:arsenate reductase
VNQRLFWPLEDPAEFQGSRDDELDKFREVRDDIKHRLEQWLDDPDT